MARKTIAVGTILHMANHFLASDNTNNDERQGICDMITSVLHLSDNYNGFAYLPTNEVEGAGTRRQYFASASNVDDYWISRNKTEKLTT
jgi:hypothetical protein